MAIHAHKKARIAAIARPDHALFAKSRNNAASANAVSTPCIGQTAML